MRRRLGPALAAALVAQCAALPELEPNTCGNGVVEGGEDCDRFSDPALGANLTCGEGCRYRCDPDAANPACPAGWSCGQDGVCRFSEGAFEDRGAARPLAARELSARDLDGDGHLDLVGGDADTVAVRFGDGEGGFSEAVTRATPFPSGPRALARLEATDGRDLLNVYAEGVDVFLGESSRALEPAGAQSFAETAFAPAGAEDVRLVPMRAPGRPVDDLLAVYVRDGGVFAQVDEGRAVSLFPASRALATDLQVGLLDASSPAFPVAVQGGTTVRLVRLRCPVDERCGPVDVMVAALPTIDVGRVGEIAEGARIADLDGDGLGDVVASVEARPGRERVLVWARQRTLGTFESAARLLVADQRCAERGPTCDPWPLAVGDLDGDGDADFVYPEGIYLREGGLVRVYPQLVEPWRSATIADLDADGRPDVAASSLTRPLLQIVRNQLPNLDTIILDAGEPVVDLRAGDFDGDGVTDIALRQPDAARDRTGVAVSFGSADGRWSNPETMATFGAITAWSAGVLPSRTLPVDDAIADLVIQAREEGGGRVGFLLGSARRQLSAPIALPREPGRLAAVPSLAVGVPTGRARDDLVVFSYDGSIYRMVRAPSGYTTSSAERFDRRNSCLEPAALGAGCVQAVTGRFAEDDPGSVVVVNRRPGCPLEVAESPVRVTRLTFGDGSVSCEAWSTEGLPAISVDAQVVLRSGDLADDGVSQAILLYDTSEAAGLATWRPGGGPPTVLTAPAQLRPRDLTVIDVDADVERELAVLSEEGLWVVDRLAFATEPSIRLGPEQSSSARRVVSGDLDRDGLDDLVLGGGDRVWVFFGQQAWRGGPPPSPTLTSSP